MENLFVIHSAFIYLLFYYIRHYVQTKIKPKGGWGGEPFHYEHV